MDFNKALRLLQETKSIKITVYHGSPSKIDEFKYEFANKGNDQLGSGFYFTTDKDEARSYGKNVHEVELSLTNPLDADKKGSVSYSTIVNFIKNSPDLEDALSNWGDVEEEGENKIIREAASNYTFTNKNIVRGLFNLANDFYPNNPKEFNESIYKFLKYDGVVKKHNNGITHYVAFFPSQISIKGK